MNWFPDAQALLDELQDVTALTPEERQTVQLYISRGANTISALRMGGNEMRIWQYLAQEFERTFYPTQQTVRVLFTDLINVTDVLATGWLPHRTRGNQLQVLTYSPTDSVTEVERFPRWIVTPSLITPTLWRTLFELGYPKSITGALTLEQASALVTFTTTGTNTTVTDNQKAEITAIVHGFNFIDPTINPPNPALRHLITLPSKAMNMCYPHHEEGEALVVMMVNPDDEAAIRSLQTQTQRRIIPTITTQEYLNNLLMEEDAANRNHGLTP